MTKDQYLAAARAAGQLAGIFVPGGGAIGEAVAQVTSLIIGEARRELTPAEAAEVDAEMATQWQSDASKTNDELAAEAEAAGQAPADVREQDAPPATGGNG
jgi:hypothetical protein